jgi:hypothetical protein
MVMKQFTMEEAIQRHEDVIGIIIKQIDILTKENIKIKKELVKWKK